MNDRLDLTDLIRRAENGDAEAADRLFAATYASLSKLARMRLVSGGRNALLDTGSLVHESYLRFATSGALNIQDRVHFLHWAGRVMRSVIVDFRTPPQRPAAWCQCRPGSVDDGACR
jgi:hypothetical protein